MDSFVLIDTATKMYWAQLGPFRRLIAVRKGAELHYLHHDHLGSTKAISGTTGGPMKYYPFGSAYQEIASPPTDNLYTGQKRDLSTGLYFYGARYFSPGNGTFTQPDTIMPRPGDPQSLNRYAYCLSNPLKYVDPSGFDTMIVPGLGGEKDYDDPIVWKDWIMASEGWTEDQWNEWYGAWTAPGADRQALVAEYGVNIFDWKASNFGSGNSYTTDTYQASRDLASQMRGMKDVTIIGHSKGGAVMESLDAAAFYGSPPIVIRRMIFIDAAINPLAELGIVPFGIRPATMSQSKDWRLYGHPEIITINNWLDPVGGRIEGATNYQVIGLDGGAWFPPHGVKSFMTWMVFGRGSSPAASHWAPPGAPAPVPAPTPTTR